MRLCNPSQSRAAREQARLSQAKVSRATGVSRTQLALFEVGKYLLDDASLKALRRFYEDIGALAAPSESRAAEIAISHHEKFDGSGYPNGLQGDAIPLSGRIVALAPFRLRGIQMMDVCAKPIAAICCSRMPSRACT